MYVGMADGQASGFMYMEACTDAQPAFVPCSELMKEKKKYYRHLWMCLLHCTTVNLTVGILNFVSDWTPVTKLFRKLSLNPLACAEGCRL